MMLSDVYIFFTLRSNSTARGYPYEFFCGCLWPPTINSPLVPAVRHHNSGTTHHHACLLSTDSNTTWRLSTAEFCWHHVTASNGDFVYFQATYVFYTHLLNGYFPGEWVSRLPIDNKGH